MSRINWLGILCCLSLISVSVSAQTATSPAFTREIQLPTLSQEELVVVPFDSEVFAAADDGYSDVRVVGPDGQMVPFLLRQTTETTVKSVRRSWTVQNPTVRPVAETGLEIEFLLARTDPVPQGLRVVTPLKDFEQRVQVFGIEADDVQALVSDGLIFDYSRFMDVGRSEVLLPDHSYRQFRVVIDALSSEQESQLMELTRTMQGDDEAGRTETTTIQRRPFRIDRIELFTETAKQEIESARRVTWPGRSFEVSHDVEEGQTIIEIITRREPVTAFRLKTESRNFSRRVTVQAAAGSTGHPAWDEISKAAVSKFQLGSMQQEHLEIQIPELRAEKLRLIIENQDSPPLQVDGVDTIGHNYEVAFLASPGSAFQLQYGPGMEPVRHDTAALSEAFRQGINVVAGKLGAPTEMAAPDVRAQRTLGRLLNHPLFLGTLIGVLVLFFGWGLYNASRRIDQLPRDDS